LESKKYSGFSSGDLALIKGDLGNLVWWVEEEGVSRMLLEWPKHHTGNLKGSQ